MNPRRKYPHKILRDGRRVNLGSRYPLFAKMVRPSAPSRNDRNCFASSKWAEAATIPIACSIGL